MVNRVEFQQRGSPHIHALFWVKYEKSSNDDIVKLVDKYITYQNDKSIELENLVSLQIMHRHAKTCKKNNDLATS